MNRNVYSLILPDNVVDAVDKLACERGTSRSGLINQILAEYLSCPIPETRIRDVFSRLEKLTDGLENFQFQELPGEFTVSIRSVLHYRYRPTVHYTLELYRDCEPFLGELRASFRTQNSSLLELSEAFFQFWESLEEHWVASRFPEGKIPCSIAPGRYTRRLQCPQNQQDCTCERTAQAILSYIREFDSALKKYCAGTDPPENTKWQIETHYLHYLEKAVIL